MSIRRHVMADAGLSPRTVRAPFDLVLWDFDGTLANNLERGLSIYNTIALKYGFLPISDPQASRNLSLRAFLRRHRIPLAKVPIALRDFFEMQSRDMESVPLVDGISELLAELEGRYRLGVVSSNTGENIRRCLRANQVEHHFEMLVGSGRLFGKARAIKRVVRAERVHRARVLYVGDEIRDVEAAQKAGVQVAAVTWGVNSEVILRRHRPNYVVGHPRELRTILSTDTTSSFEENLSP